MCVGCWNRSFGTQKSPYILLDKDCSPGQEQQLPVPMLLLVIVGREGVKCSVDSAIFCRSTPITSPIRLDILLSAISLMLSLLDTTIIASFSNFVESE